MFNKFFKSKLPLFYLFIIYICFIIGYDLAIATMVISGRR